MKKLVSSGRKTEAGYSLVELVIAMVVLVILAAISIPYVFNYRKLYRSEDQALKILDLMRETGQLALTRRRNFRFEIDLTANAVLVIDERNAQPDLLVKSVPLDLPRDVRIDVNPTGVTRPIPPNYTNAAYAVDAVGHLNLAGTTVIGNNVWAARFRSDGSVVNAANTPISATLFVWPPVAFGSLTPRTPKEIRAITMFGGSGAIRYWKYDGTTFVPYQ